MTTLPASPGQPSPWWEVHAQVLREAILNPGQKLREARDLVDTETGARHEDLALLVEVALLWADDAYGSDTPFLRVANNTKTRDLLRAFASTHVEALLRLWTDCSEPVLKARLADFLWSYKGKARVPLSVAETAVDAYLQQSASPLLSWSVRELATSRALYLSIACKLTNRSQATIAQLKSLAYSAITQQKLGTAIKLMKFSLAAKVSDEEIADVSLELSNQLAEGPPSFIEESAHELAQRFATNEPQRQAHQLLHALVPLKFAKLFAANGTPSGALAATIYASDAVHRLSKVGGADVHLEQAHKLLHVTCPPQSVPAQRNRIRATERKRDAQEQVHGRADHRVHQAG